MKSVLLFSVIVLLSSLAMATSPDPLPSGRHVLAEGDATAAVKIYAESLRLNPFDPVALNNMGVAKAAAGDYQAALDYFLQANSRAPHRRDIKENLENLQTWVKSYLGVSTMTGAALNDFAPEPPALWPAPLNDISSPTPTRPLTPTCNNDPCK